MGQDASHFTEDTASESDAVSNQGAEDGYSGPGEVDVCDETEGLCSPPGEEAADLPGSGSVPLQELAENVEKGEEQFGGCQSIPNPMRLFPLGFLVLWSLFVRNTSLETRRHG